MSKSESAVAQGSPDPAGDDTSGVEERPDDGGVGIDRDTVFEVMSNRRRRSLIRYLKAQQNGDGGAEISDISRQIAAWEQGVSVDQVNYSDRKNVHTSLYQFHLPKMDDAGFVEYDQRSGNVSLTDSAENLDIYIETGSENEELPWERYLPGLAAPLAVLAGTVWFLDRPLLGVSDGGWAVAIAAVFLASALAYAYRSRTDADGLDEG